MLLHRYRVDSLVGHCITKEAVVDICYVFCRCNRLTTRRSTDAKAAENHELLEYPQWKSSDPYLAGVMRRLLTTEQRLAGN